MEEKTITDGMSDDELKYMLEEIELELQKMYIDYDLFTRRVTRAEQEVKSYRDELLKREKANAPQPKYRSQEK